MKPQQLISDICEDCPDPASVCFLSTPDRSFEKAYLAVRQQEARLLTDAQVLALPVSPAQQYRREWACRRRSAEKLRDHLQRHPPGAILDLGCGNGWFAGLLARDTRNAILGLDINLTELQQAARLFGHARCRFAWGDVFEASLPLRSFQYILLNSTVQYFPDLQQLLQRLTAILAPGGEIHLIDSPVYQPLEIDAAKDRSKAYYQEAGHPEMADRYFHHSWEGLQGFYWRKKYDPDSWLHRLARRVGWNFAPFPWIIIKGSQ